MTAAAFALAAGAGALARWSVRRSSARPIGAAAATLGVNVIGSFALGLLAGVDETTTLVVGTAGLGAFTTFSTFALDTIELAAKPTHAAAYLGASVVLGVGAAWLGLRLA